MQQMGPSCRLLRARRRPFDLLGLRQAERTRGPRQSSPSLCYLERPHVRRLRDGRLAASSTCATRVSSHGGGEASDLDRWWTEEEWARRHLGPATPGSGRHAYTVTDSGAPSGGAIEQACPHLTSADHEERPAHGAGRLLSGWGDRQHQRWPAPRASARLPIVERASNARQAVCRRFMMFSPTGCRRRGSAPSMPETRLRR